MKMSFLMNWSFNFAFSEGFEAERIEALLHKIELSQKHQYDKFGMMLAIVSNNVFS